MRDVFATSSLHRTIFNDDSQCKITRNFISSRWELSLFRSGQHRLNVSFFRIISNTRNFSIYSKFIYSFFLSHTPRRPFRPENKWAILLCQKPSSKTNLYYYSTVALRYFKFYILATLWRQSSAVQRRFNTTYYLKHEHE